MGQKACDFDTGDQRWIPASYQDLILFFSKLFSKHQKTLYLKGTYYAHFSSLFLFLDSTRVAFHDTQLESESESEKKLNCLLQGSGNSSLT